MTTHPPGATRRDPWDRFGWLMAAVWLVLLGYPVKALLESRAAPAWVVVAWIALVAFIVLYLAGFIRGSRGGGGLGRPPVPGQYGVLAGLIGCSLVSVPATGTTSLSFLPFIMSFASYNLSRPWHWITAGGAVVLTAVCALLHPGEQLFITFLIIVGMLGAVNTVSTWLIIRSAEADRLGLELATSEAREALARDVHDLVGHSLTVVRLKSQLARRLIDVDSEQAKAELADIEALTAEAVAGVRASVAGVRATTLEEQLASSREALRSAGIAMQVDGDASTLSPVQALTASWILREATTNVLRHASARTVHVRVASGRLVVTDDGVGGVDEHTKGNGVNGMRERAAAAGAGFEIRPAQSGGTRVEVVW